MSGEGKYDDLLLNVLREEGQIIPFLDAIFGFLYRRTDFYVVQEKTDTKIGFIPGVAEKIVRNAFRKWQNLMLQNENISVLQEDMIDVVHEEEVVTTEDLSIECEVSTEKYFEQENCKSDDGDDISCDIYNGADCGKYRWSQTRSEVDIKVPVPCSVCRSSDVQVDIQHNHLIVEVKDSTGQWSMLVDGRISHKHIRDESIWTLLPSKLINIHLQKVGEHWWDSLLETEHRLDLTKLDVSRHFTDLPEEDHMQVEKLIAQGDMKNKAIVSSEQQEQLDTLERAWHLKGSPFKGIPFDPSILQHPP